MARWVSMVAASAQRLELPTWLLAVTIYGGWLALTFWWHALPIWLAAPLGAWLTAWHMSLQHEIIHGHPTRSQAINTALAVPPLNLWLPYQTYRHQHLSHHRDCSLTDPLEDPESTYLSADAWRRAGPVRRWLLCATNTVIGRVLLGPPLSVGQFWMRQALLLASGRARFGVWWGHALGVSVVLGWVCLVCRIDWVTYVACFAYPGTALSMIRSLAEHQAAERPEDRTAVVEHAGLLGLLFLNNNLHVLHHASPGVPWFALPAQWRLLRADLLGARRGPVYDGYRDVARRFALRPHHPGPHPIERPTARRIEGVAHADRSAGGLLAQCLD